MNKGAWSRFARLVACGLTIKPSRVCRFAAVTLVTEMVFFPKVLNEILRVGFQERGADVSPTSLHPAGRYRDVIWRRRHRARVQTLWLRADHQRFFS